MTLKAAFIGLGAMGTPMAGHLKAHGLLLAVSSRTQANADAVAKELGVTAPSLADIAAQCDVIAVCVTADADVLGLIDALVPHLKAGTIVIDHSARGEVPRDLAEVTARAKDIQYSSRTRLITEFMGMRQKQQRLLQELMALVPEDQRRDPAYRRAEVYAGGSLVNLFHLIYRNKPYEGHYKDYEFSFGSMQQHWHSGMDDMQCTLREPQWFARPDAEHPFVTHDVHCED